MIKRKINVLTVVLVLITFVGVYGYFTNKNYREWLLKQPKKYCYHTYYGPANPTFVITDLKYQEQLLEYHVEVEKTKKPTVFNFPLKTLPPNDQVYIVGYDVDSTLVKIVSLYNRGANRGGNYLEGWVYCKSLHDISGQEYNKIRGNVSK